MATHRDGDRDGVTLIVVIVIIVLLSADLPLQNVLDPLLQLRRVRKVVLIRHRQPDAVSLGRGGERGATIVWGCGEVGMRKYGDVGTRDGRWGHGGGRRGHGDGDGGVPGLLTSVTLTTPIWGRERSMPKVFSQKGMSCGGDTGERRGGTVTQ